jgi:hypothetical protein
MKLTFFSVLTFLSGIFVFADTVQPVPPSMDSKAFSWVNITKENRVFGQMASSGYLRGKIVVLASYDFSDKTLNDSFLQLQEVWNAYRSKPFVVIGSHSGGDVQEAKENIESLRLTFPIYENVHQEGAPPLERGCCAAYSYNGSVVCCSSNVRAVRGVVGSLILSTRVFLTPKQYTTFLDWHIDMLPGKAYNVLRDFNKAFPVEAMEYKNVYDKFSRSDDIKRVAILEKIARQAKDCDPSSPTARPLTKDRVNLLIDVYKDLMTNSNERISQESKNCIVELLRLKNAL